MRPNGSSIGRIEHTLQDAKATTNGSRDRRIRATVLFRPSPNRSVARAWICFWSSGHHFWQEWSPENSLHWFNPKPFQVWSATWRLPKALNLKRWRTICLPTMRRSPTPKLSKDAGRARARTVGKERAATREGRPVSSPRWGLRTSSSAIASPLKRWQFPSENVRNATTICWMASPNAHHATSLWRHGAITVWQLKSAGWKAVPRKSMAYSPSAKSARCSPESTGPGLRHVKGTVQGVPISVSWKTGRRRKSKSSKRLASQPSKRGWRMTRFSCTIAVLPNLLLHVVTSFTGSEVAFLRTWGDHLRPEERAKAQTSGRGWSSCRLRTETMQSPLTYQRRQWCATLAGFSA